jgi:hypothetical protein
VAEFSRKVAVLLWIMPVKGFLQPVLLPRGVYCRHNAVSGCTMDSCFEAWMVGIIAILLAKSRILFMKRLRVNSQ